MNNNMNNIDSNIQRNKRIKSETFGNVTYRFFLYI